MMSDKKERRLSIPIRVIREDQIVRILEALWEHTESPEHWANWNLEGILAEMKHIGKTKWLPEGVYNTNNVEEWICRHLLNISGSYVPSRVKKHKCMNFLWDRVRSESYDYARIMTTIAIVPPPDH